MKYLSYVAHPAAMFLLIGAFAWLLFFSPAGQGINKAKEMERERETEGAQHHAPPVDPNLNVVAGQPGQGGAGPEPTPEQTPFDPANPQNQPQGQWGQHLAGQADPGAQGQQQALWNTPPGDESPFNDRREARILRKWDRNTVAVANVPAGQFQDPSLIRPVLNNAQPAQAPQNQVMPNQGRPIPVPDQVLQEGHWIGLEVIPITPTLAKANNIPPDVSGVLVDEVTLLSAEAGLLAGDVICSINGQPVYDLKSFRQATRQVAMSNQANVLVYRGGSGRQIAINSTEELGIAQVESAPMILSGARAPHGYYGPCDRCHSIAKTSTNTNNLKMDNGDNLTKVAPVIHRGVPAPHRDRGECIKCHTVI